MAGDAQAAFELFLVLTPPRVAAAEQALQLADPRARHAALSGALVPLAVDALLLGAEGPSALALALVEATHASPSALTEALASLRDAAQSLTHGDRSGARVDEGRLLEQAARLRAGAPSAVEPAAPSAPSPRPAAAPLAVAAPDEAWSPPIADDLVAAFLDECTERIDGVAEKLLELEQHHQDAALIDALFRDLHTLKGSSAFAGLTRLNRVAHRAEDRMGELREGKRRVDRPLIDALLASLDVMKAIVERARAGHPIDVSIDAVLARLERPEAAAPASPTAPQPAPPAAAEPGRASGASTLRIDFEKVDLLLNLVGEIVLARGRLNGAAEVQSALLREVGAWRKGATPTTSADPPPQLVEELTRAERVLRESWTDLEQGLGGLGLALGQLRDTVMKLRMVPMARLFGKYQRTVRELAGQLGKEVQVELLGGDTELDKVLVERLDDPLLHLVRNAVDHGIEPPDVRARAGKPRQGRLVLSAAQRGGRVLVAITDDGAGMSPERLRAKALEKGLLDQESASQLSDQESLSLIFRAGFSTAATVSDVSGRGVGMDVVKDAITRLKGDIRLSSTPGEGTRLELSLPLTLAITQVLTARVGTETIAIPLDAIVSTQRVAPSTLERVGLGSTLRFGEALVPVAELAPLLGLDASTSLGGADEARSVVIVSLGEQQLGLLVDQVLGRHEVVIKSLGPLLAAAPCAAGATLIADQVLLVVDLAAVAARAASPSVGSPSPAFARPPTSGARHARVLVVEDAEATREALRRELSFAGFDVVTADDGQHGLELALAQRFDAVTTDVVMPRLDGHALARALRSSPHYAAVPIVMLTSRDSRTDALRGQDAGADAYLTKPTAAGELVQVLDTLLGRARAAARR